MPMQMFVRSFVHYTTPSLKECPLCNPSGAPTQRSNLDGQDKTFCHPPPRHGWSIPRFAWMCTELKSGSAKRNLCHKIDRGCGRPRPQRRSKFWRVRSFVCPFRTICSVCRDKRRDSIHSSIVNPKESPRRTTLLVSRSVRLPTSFSKHESLSSDNCSNSPNNVEFSSEMK